MKTETGKCRFCNQYMTVEVPESYTQEDIDEEVRKKCSCPEAKILTRREENIASAEGAIRTFFKDKDELQTISKIMMSAVEPMINHKIGKLSISYGGYSGSMKPGKEDNIKLQLKYTTEESIET